mgnify:CR=1 FL=1
MVGKRLIQVFLSTKSAFNPGIFEVSVDEADRLYCTCPGWQTTYDCKHLKFVRSKMATNNGTYPLEISKKASPQEAELAQSSDEEFREFIIKYGRIEVF